jgi:hypothetical protein
MGIFDFVSARNTFVAVVLVRYGYGIRVVLSREELFVP